MSPLGRLRKGTPSRARGIFSTPHTATSRGDVRSPRAGQHLRTSAKGEDWAVKQRHAAGSDVPAAVPFVAGPAPDGPAGGGQPPGEVAAGGGAVGAPPRGPGAVGAGRGGLRPPGRARGAWAGVLGSPAGS